MRYLIALLLFINTTAFECSKNDFNIVESGCMKGKLVVDGPCKNLVVKILEGTYASSRVETKWTDPATNMVHENVFTVMNVCSFPDNIKENETFYFYFVRKPADQNCAVCMIYRPTPSISNNIYISDKPCN